MDEYLLIALGALFLWHRDRRTPPVVAASVPRETTGDPLLDQILDTSEYDTPGDAVTDFLNDSWIF